MLPYEDMEGRTSASEGGSHHSQKRPEHRQLMLLSRPPICGVWMQAQGPRGSWACPACDVTITFVQPRGCEPGRTQHLHGRAQSIGLLHPAMQLQVPQAVDPEVRDPEHAFLTGKDESCLQQKLFFSFLLPGVFTQGVLF